MAELGRARSMANALFVCLHNAGRSQMSEALFERAAVGRHRARSAGTTPADRVHPEVVAVMAELGIDLSDRVPRKLTEDDARWADVVVTMGCGDKCPFIPGRRYVDWDLDDPKGRPIEQVRATRDEIDGRVRALLAVLDGPGSGMPVACSLDAAGMERRLVQVGALGAAALVDVERSAGKARLRFRPAGSTRASLEQFVEAERACCPFLDLGMAEGEDLIELTIAAPPEGEAIVDELVAAFSQNGTE